MVFRQKEKNVSDGIKAHIFSSLTTPVIIPISLLVTEKKNLKLT